MATRQPQLSNGSGKGRHSEPTPKLLDKAEHALLSRNAAMWYSRE
jgi:hypothetical protein